MGGITLDQMLDYLVDLIALLVIVGILALIHQLFKVLFISPGINKIKRLLHEKDYSQARTLLLDALQKRPKSKVFLSLKKQLDQNTTSETLAEDQQLQHVPSDKNSPPVKQKTNYFITVKSMKRNPFWIGTNLACFLLFIYQCLSYSIFLPEFAFPAAWWLLTMLFSVGFIIYSVVVMRNFQTSPISYFLYQGFVGLFFFMEYIILYFISAQIYSSLNVIILILPIVPEVAVLYEIYHRRIRSSEGKQADAYRIIFLITAAIMSFIAPLLKSLNAVQTLSWIFLLSAYIFSLSFSYLVDYVMINKNLR